MGDDIRHLITSAHGVTAIEYGLIAALVAMAIVAAVGIVGTDLSGIFSSVANSL